MTGAPQQSQTKPHREKEPSKFADFGKQETIGLLSQNPPHG
jgi:hypothetical protein